MSISLDQINKEIVQIVEQVSSFFDDEVPLSSTDLCYTLDEWSVNNEAISLKHFQPWLAIFEQAIGWLLALHLALTGEQKSKFEEIKVPQVLTGTACTQALAIRKLCLYGLDIPAKAVLRSLSETLNVCTVTTYDKELRSRFQEPESFEEADKVWYKYFRGNEIQKKIKEIFLAHNFDPEVHEEFKEWQREETKLTNQAVHPSFFTATLATYPFPVDKRTIRLGATGSSTAFSIRTITHAFRTIWFYSMLGFGSLIKPHPIDGSVLYEPDMKNLDDRVLIAQHMVFDKLTRKYWNYNYDWGDDE